jgi:DNA-binding response OmpR family regulator
MLKLKQKLLILEDHPDCVSIYKDLLGQYELTVVSCLKDFEAALKTNEKFDLLIADLKLPDGEFLGWVEAHQLEACWEDLPTIIVSSSRETATLARCFEWGASDYLVKPFVASELVVKVQKALGTFTARSSGPYAGAERILDELTTIEEKIFQIFLRSPSQYVTRDQVMLEVWKKVKVNSKTLDVHLSNIRKKINGRGWEIDYEDMKGWRLKRVDLVTQ